MEKLEDFLQKNITIEDVKGFTDWRKNLKNLKGQASFTEYRASRPVVKAARGFITIESLLDTLPDPIEKPANLLKVCKNWLVLDYLGGNTYNFCGYLDNYLNFDVITVQNPDNGEIFDLAFLRVGLSLDPRGYYSKYGLAAFYGDEHGDHYDFYSWLGNRAKIGGGIIYTTDNKKIGFSLDATAIDENASLYIYDSGADYDIFCDTSDADDLKEAIESETSLEIEKIKVDYCSYLDTPDAVSPDLEDEILQEIY